MCDFDEHPDSRQNGIRPCVVLQNDRLNAVKAYTLVIVAPMSTKGSERIPSHAFVAPDAENGLSEPGFVKCEQIQTVPQSRLFARKGTLAPEVLERVDAALRRAVGL